MMWGCMSWDGVRYLDTLARLMVGWMLSSILKFWRMSFRIAWSGGEKVLLISSFSRTMIPSTLVNWLNCGLKIMEFRSWSGLHNLQISTLLNISGFTSKNSS